MIGSGLFKKIVDSISEADTKIDANTDAINQAISDISGLDTKIDQSISDISDIDANIGLKGDYLNIPFVSAESSILAYLNTGYYHIHGEAFVYPKYAAPVQLLSGSGAWNLTGNIIEIIPANILLKPFDLHWISISNISGNSDFIIDIYSGAIGEEILISSVEGFRNSNFIQEGARRIQTPRQLANTRISCKLSDSTAGTLTCTIKFNGHYYG